MRQRALIGGWMASSTPESNPSPPEHAIRVNWRDPRPAHQRPATDELVRRRHHALDVLRRKRLGFWRALGRSNRLFPRKLVVTYEGKWIIAIALLLGAAAVNTGNNLLYLVLSLAISVIAISGMLSELCLRDLELRRRYPAELQLGEATPLRLEVFNDKKRAALHIEVGEVVDDSSDVQVRDGYVLHLGPHETGQAFAAIRPLRRGPIATAGLQLTTAYPFGFARKSRLFDDQALFLALPGVTPTELPWRGALDRGATETSRKTGHGDAFAGLRDARPGDAQRDIYWKASARRQRLIVREWQAEANRLAVVQFGHVAPDAGDQPVALDAACARVAGLCAALLAAGFAVGLQTLDGGVLPAADPTGQTDQLLRIRRHLAWLTLADRPPRPEWPLADGAWAQAVRTALARQAALRQGQPLQFAALSLSAPAEVFRVTFASRPEVSFAGQCDVHVTLQNNGDIAQMTRVQAKLQGAA